MMKQVKLINVLDGETTFPADVAGIRGIPSQGAGGLPTVVLHAPPIILDSRASARVVRFR